MNAIEWNSHPHDSSYLRIPFCLDFLIIRLCNEKISPFQAKVTQVGKDIRHIADRLKITAESIEDRKS
jgi:hypothetical protein